MGLKCNGITDVRALALAGGTRSDGRCIYTPLTALVQWRSDWKNVLHQVYVNGRLSGVTIAPEQRKLAVPVPASREAPIRIEVFAVDFSEAHNDLRDQINSCRVNHGRVILKMLRSQNLPFGANAHIYFNDGAGEIDYGAELPGSPMQIWPARQDKCGFGMGAFGEGGFGYEYGAGVGFGKGSFGNSSFGMDADTIEWVSPFLRGGVYKFAVRSTDAKGSPSKASETGPIVVIPPATPADRLEVASFDKQANTLLLRLS